VKGLRSFEGTLLLVSHDRWFVSKLATRVVEVKPDGIVDYQGTYEEYVHFCGDDHLDADRVILKAKREKKKTKTSKAEGSSKGGRRGSQGRDKRGRDKSAASKNGGKKTNKGRLQAKLDALMARMETADTRVSEIDELFCQLDYYEQTPPDEVRALEDERSSLQDETNDLTRQWERAEERLSAIS